eukprot:6191806-Pleurochrysis_carterae.AAC.3
MGAGVAYAYSHHTVGHGLQSSQWSVMALETQLAKKGFEFTIMASTVSRNRAGACNVAPPRISLIPRIEALS